MIFDGQVFHAGLCEIVDLAVGRDANSERPPTCGRNRNGLVVSSSTVGSDTDMSIVLFSLGSIFADELDEHAWPIGFFLSLRTDTKNARVLVRYCGIKSRTKRKMGPGSIFPLIDRWQIDPYNAAWRLVHRNGTLESIVNVANEIFLLHTVTGPAGDTRLERLQ